MFDDDFIETIVKPVWTDTRNKISSGTLKDIVRLDKGGTPIINRNGDVSSSPNFMKSRDNVVFIRGSGIDSSAQHKTECVNGIRMFPQYIWIKGSAVIDELRETPAL